MGLQSELSPRRLAPLPRGVVFALGLTVLLSPGVGAGDDGSRRKIVEELLERSRLLQDIHFRVPRGLWVHWLRERAGDAALPPPVACTPHRGLYGLTIDADGQVTLSARVELWFFHTKGVGDWPVLSDRFAWDELSVRVGEGDPTPARLGVQDGFLRYAPTQPGLHVITARAVLPPMRRGSGELTLPVTPTTLTHVSVDSPRAIRVEETGAGVSFTGTIREGTHGSLPLATSDEIRLQYAPPAPTRDRPATFQLRGNVAWNLDVGRQQVSAQLEVAILGGSTDQLLLRLPPGARRVEATGPDVRDARMEGAALHVHLRGRVSGQTALRVNFELPSSSDSAALRGLGIAQGRWAGGTLVVLNSAGGSEVLPAAMSGLTERSTSEIASEALGLLPGSPVLGFAITGGAWSASVEVVDLGEFALQETIADSAHFELVFVGDGTIACRASYELRNRDRQFLRVTLPPGSRVLMARVNDESRPITALGGDEYLLPLQRSTATVMGLVSFPVEIVLIRRQESLAEKGTLRLELPRIDIPIAYAWCETFVPEAMDVEEWGGALTPVERFSREIATVRLAYGRAEAAPGSPGAPMASSTRGRSSVSLGYELGRNYWFAGKDQYERGDLVGARASLERVRELAPGSSEADRASKLLSNVQLARGEMELESQAQRVAGGEVLQKLQLGRQSTLARQQQRLSKGFRAAREGRNQEAAEAFQAAEALSDELVRRGAGDKEQQGAMRTARRELAAVRRRLEEETERLGEEIVELKRRRKYSEALGKARRLVEINKGASARTAVLPRQPLNQAEMDELAVLAAKDSAPAPVAARPFSQPTTVKSYDVRDLLVGGGFVAGVLPREALREKVGQAITGLSGPSAGVTVSNGRLVVRAGSEGQASVARTLENLRSVRGPQVDVSELRAEAESFADDIEVDFIANSPALQGFLAQNYSRDRDRGRGDEDLAREDSGRLVERLGANWGQKVPISSVRLSNPETDLAAVGAAPQSSPGGTKWALLDEAQFRTLARMGGLGERRDREAIVGTESVLANDAGVLVAFAGSTANRFLIDDTTVNLPHERYLVIVGEEGLTAVRSGKMRHWTEQSERVAFETGPEPLALPRVGREVRFERTLVRPTDRLAVRATYSWKRSRQ
jgi:hypothetical protein